MTNVFEGIHDAIENSFAEDIIYDPTGVAITIQAVVEVEFKSLGGIERIEIPAMLSISQNELDDNSITLAADDVVTVRSVNHKIAEIENDGRGGVAASIWRVSV